MDELPQGCAAAPAGHTQAVHLGRLIDSADQEQQHMAVLRVVVIAKPTKVGGHAG